MLVKNDHKAVINRILNYIQQNPEKDLSLQVLAGLSSFSPYHFHRIFTSVVGENPYHYVKKERVERAAKLLIHNPHLSVTDVSLQCGFSSSATFARVFKEHFGVNATFFRQDRKNRKMESKNWEATSEPSGYDGVSEAAAERIAQRDVELMKVEVRTLPTYRVAYVRILDGMDLGYNQKITGAFNKARDWVGSRGLFNPPHTLCIGAVYETLKLTSPDRRRYDACFTVPDSVVSGSGGVDVQNIEGGLYAVSRIELEYADEESFGITLAMMGERFEYMYGEWLTRNAFELEDKPCLEFYLTPPGPPMIVIEAAVPVKPL